MVSTAGLDKHKQSKERGITIDMGFTFFSLENKTITLVDAPGHADLIQSVISCANIIDLAFLVIDAKRGTQVKTGEHLIILNLLNIPNLFVLVNKIDLVNEQELEKLEGKIRATLSATKFQNKHRIFRVSAKDQIGFENLKTELSEFIKFHPPTRHKEKELKYLIDHHFTKKGRGDIFTGTVLSGKAKIGDTLTLLPQNLNCTVKSIQMAKQSTDTMEAGDRCGIGVSKLKNSEIHRGTIATNRKQEFERGKAFLVQVKETKLFKPLCTFGQQVTVNHKMREMQGRLFPFRTFESSREKEIKIRKVKFNPKRGQKSYRAVLWTMEEEYVQEEDQFLLSRLDLGPKQLRIMGLAEIENIVKPPITFYKVHEKSGTVYNPDYSNNSVIVEGLVQSKKGAEAFVGKTLEPPFGKVLKPFGQGGKIEVEVRAKYRGEKNSHVLKGTKVRLRRLKSFKLRYSQSYK